MNLYLTPTQSACIPILLILGLGLVLKGSVSRTRTWQRVTLYGVSIFLALRYIWWRGTETLAPPGLTVDFIASGALYLIELAALVGSISAFVLMSRTRERSDEVNANLDWWKSRKRAPRIAVLIATYNEDLEVLERTIAGARALAYERKEIWVLDDGRRGWLRDYCAARDVRYLTRPDNKGSKAGNLNHALGVLNAQAEPPEFFAVLDADFVPHRGFLSRTLALFHDPTVGLVQTPQHFFNADPIQHNLGLSRSYPDEQRYFFDHMQPARDAWGTAICCGTSSMSRMSAVKAIGGFPTSSVTEDFMLTMSLQEKGFRTVYLNEALTEGLAPEGLKEYVTQRARWCLGLMQIARSDLGPLSRRRMRLRDRWSVIDSAFYWLFSFVFRIAAFVFPLLYWFFNITVVNAAVPDVISYFGTYYAWVLLTSTLLSPGMVVPIFHDVSQLVGAFPITRAAITGLLRPHGHPFSVTAKGGDRSRIVVQWAIMRPFAILLGLTVLGLTLGIFFDAFAYYDAGDGKSVVLFWTIYNLVVLVMTVLACVELPRREVHIADAPELTQVSLPGGGRHNVWMSELTRDSARLRGQDLPAGSVLTLQIRDVGAVDGVVLLCRSGTVLVRLEPDEAEREALIIRLHAEDEVTPGVLRSNYGELIGDFTRRLTSIGPSR
ncbi:cellulose synthase catalytic subunit [Roseicyclus sp. F158]|uniref:Cellulose synthase catalytic subunit n=1 Tax=Tropicimonas omnivorans TaxID=3075590 RepID=A0ABU3DJW7_9RHOB|nr:cellulose synthase catalytic subunit [Roseicyclus sp. F158]MDT0683961.1 cellulose synthase catalytic subunit [Roseicyclus sp. F158]